MCSLIPEAIYTSAIVNDRIFRRSLHFFAARLFCSFLRSLLRSSSSVNCEETIDIIVIRYKSRHGTRYSPVQREYNLFVVAEARIVLNMFLIWAKNRSSLFLFINKKADRFMVGRVVTTRVLEYEVVLSSTEPTTLLYS